MDVITQTKHYFSSFQTANLVEGITGLSSHYIIPSSSCKVHRQASNGHCFFFFFQLLTTSPQWQANFDVRTWTDFCTAVAVRCQHDRKHMLSPIRNCWQCQLSASVFPIKSKWTHKCKNKGKQKANTLTRWLMPSFSVSMELFSFQGKREQNFTL